MRNIKFVGIFAACGFVLSFVFGLFSHSSFLFIFLRAIIIGIIFVLLGILVSFIFNKFLLDSSSAGFDSEDLSDLSSSKKTETTENTSHKVDVVVRDEALSPSDSDNHFVVGDNCQMLKASDINNSISGKTENDKDKEDSKVEADNKSENNSFVPMKGFENISNIPKKDTNTPIVQDDNVEEPKSENVFSDEDLDTLPDMENLDLSEYENTEEDKSNSYISSDLGSSAASMYKQSGISGPEIKDAALIAKAISTALSEDN